MLDLDDPLWRKLNDASYREFDIPQSLSLLEKTWDADQAHSLLWSCLFSEQTCYSATYAAIPHLLKIAEPQANRQQRRELAIALGGIAWCAFHDRHEMEKGKQAHLRGLPETLAEWSARRDHYRNRMAALEDPNYSLSRFEQAVVLPYYKNSLETDPFNEDDLEKIRLMKREFFEALPKIRSLCERAFLEHLSKGELGLYFLSGIAAADGFHDLAQALNWGAEGTVRCSFCDWGHEYHLFEDRVALYAEEERDRYVGRALDDWRDGEPLRADGFMLAVAADKRIADRRAAALLELAGRATVSLPTLLVRNFLGRFHCCKCGAEGSVAAI